MNPLFNSSGYVLDSRELRVLQKQGWVSFPLSDIAEVKKSSFATFIVRLATGKKETLDLSHLSTDSFSAVNDALKNAAHSRRASAARPQ